MKLLGVDTGGTFTDFVLVDDGNISTLKIPSTPADPSQAFLKGLSRLSEEFLQITHGSTVATNALLEGKGADVIFLVTDGFRDLLTLGRQNRPSLYALHPIRNRFDLPPERIIEIRERILPDGTAHLPLSDQEVNRIMSLATKHSGASVAICLLHSYANPVHEKILEKVFLKKGFQVSRSSSILPEYREFERASTTVVNAMVSPIMGRYLKRLGKNAPSSLIKVMQSNGGTMNSVTAGRKAVHTVLSGPAGGMAGAFRIASGNGFANILTFDMGGTSTDVGLCAGTVPTSSQANLAGWPIKIPMIDIHTIGAGGGSIADLDAGGALRVGPASAGADPGPACYGKGHAVTVTDANLFLGRLLPNRFLGGNLKLDVSRCCQAIIHLASQAGLGPGHLAEGVVEVVEENMAAALRVVSVERGHDPRDFILFSYGGAGGLHACSLAEKLGMKKVFIPLYPGLLSAVGMLLAPPMREYSVSFLNSSAVELDALNSAFEPLNLEAQKEMLNEGVKTSDLKLEPSMDLRFKGQSYEINVPFTPDFLSLFLEKYTALYGYCHADQDIEIVTLRLKALGKGLELDSFYKNETQSLYDPPENIEVRWKGRNGFWKVLSREHLKNESGFRGPALILEETATHLLPPGWFAMPNQTGHLILEKRDEA